MLSLTHSVFQTRQATLWTTWWHNMRAHHSSFLWDNITLCVTIISHTSWQLKRTLIKMALAWQLNVFTSSLLTRLSFYQFYATIFNSSLIPERNDMLETLWGVELQLGTVDQGAVTSGRLRSTRLMMYWSRSDYMTKAQSKTTDLHINHL